MVAHATAAARSRLPVLVRPALEAELREVPKPISLVGPAARKPIRVRERDPATSENRQRLAGLEALLRRCAVEAPTWLESASAFAATVEPAGLQALLASALVEAIWENRSAGGTAAK